MKNEGGIGREMFAKSHSQIQGDGESVTTDSENHGKETQGKIFKPQQREGQPAKSMPGTVIIAVTAIGANELNVKIRVLRS